MELLTGIVKQKVPSNFEVRLMEYGLHLPLLIQAPLHNERNAHANGFELVNWECH
jgi:hypothetical protein